MCKDKLPGRPKSLFLSNLIQLVSLSFSVCLSVSLSLSLSLPLSLPSCLSLSVCTSLFLCLPVSVSVCLSVCLSLSVPPCLSLSVCTSLSFSVSLCLPVSLSLSLSICLSVSLPPPSPSRSHLPFQSFLLASPDCTHSSPTFLATSPPNRLSDPNRPSLHLPLLYRLPPQFAAEVQFTKVSATVDSQSGSNL